MDNPTRREQKHELLKRRFEEFGPEGALFFNQIVRTRRYGRDEASRILSLLSTYHREDLARALERASRYRAFSLSAVERILAAQARPRSSMELLDFEALQQLNEILGQSPLSTRPTSEYQDLLEDAAEEGNDSDGENNADEQNNDDDKPA